MNEVCYTLVSYFFKTGVESLYLFVILAKKKMFEYLKKNVRIRIYLSIVNTRMDQIFGISSHISVNLDFFVLYFIFFLSVY